MYDVSQYCVISIPKIQNIGKSFLYPFNIYVNIHSPIPPKKNRKKARKKKKKKKKTHTTTTTSFIGPSVESTKLSPTHSLSSVLGVKSVWE